MAGTMGATRVLRVQAVGMNDIGSRGVDSGHCGGDESMNDVSCRHR